MKYKLAKQLKDAGYPQRKHSVGYYINSESTYLPTLSELIEACIILMKPKKQFPEKYNFFELSPNINTSQSGGEKELGDLEEWVASWFFGYSLDDFDWLKNFFGSTPEEAVAKLWLELREKSLTVEHKDWL